MADPILHLNTEKIPTDATLRMMAASNDRVAASADRNTAALNAFPGKLVEASREVRLEVVGGAKDVLKDVGQGGGSLIILWFVLKLILLYLGKKWVRP